MRHRSQHKLSHARTLSDGHVSEGHRGSGGGVAGERSKARSEGPREQWYYGARARARTLRGAAAQARRRRTRRARRSARARRSSPAAPSPLRLCRLARQSTAHQTAASHRERLCIRCAPHLHRDWAHPCHICIGTGPIPTTSAPGLRRPLPHLHRDWAHPAHICAETGPAPATSAPGLGPPLPHLHRDAGLRSRISRAHCHVEELARVELHTHAHAHARAHTRVLTRVCAHACTHARTFEHGWGEPICTLTWSVAGVSPVPVQMWKGRARSRCRCGRGEPGPGADVAGASPPTDAPLRLGARTVQECARQVHRRV
jgi:hypothetical protein